MSAEALAAAARFLLTSAARERAQSAINIETVAGAAGERFMRIAVVNEDMPFLVDSIAGTVGAHGLVIDRLIHPIVPVERNGHGDITDLPEGEAPAWRVNRWSIWKRRVPTRAPAPRWPPIWR
jgi:glutamate dehydrogenase